MEQKNVFKTLTVLLAVSILVLGGTILCLVMKEGSGEEPFLSEKQLLKLPLYEPAKRGGPLPRETADSMISAYRDHGRTSQFLRKKAFGLWHDTASISEYINNVFPAFTKKYGHPVDYVWEVGFYYTLSRNSNNKIRLSCCMIPTMVNESLKPDDPGRRLDYYTCKDDPKLSIYYPKVPAVGPDKDFIFDTGEIWP